MPQIEISLYKGALRLPVDIGGPIWYHKLKLAYMKEPWDSLLRLLVPYDATN